MTNIRILVQEGMKKALKAAQKPSLSKRDVRTILKAVASQARRIKKTHDELPYGPNRTVSYQEKTPAERKEMQKSYDSLRANIARLGAPFPEGADVIFGDKFGRPDVNPHERGQRIQRGYPPEASGREKLSMTKRGPGFYSFDGSELPTMPDAPSKLNKALKDLPNKVAQTVYRPMRGPLQPDKKVTVRMRGLEDLMKQFSHTSAGRPTRTMVGELETQRNQRKKGERAILKRVDQQRKLKERLPNVVTTNPFGQNFMREGVDNRRDGADVVSNFYSERGDRLLDSMRRQNRQAKKEMMKKYGVPYKPADPTTIPKPINFRAEPDVQAEAVEMKAIRARRKLDRQIARDPNVGMHGPSHPMFHKSDLAKRVRGLEKRHKARRERIAQKDAENSSPVTDPMRARLIRAINKGNEQ